jgi:hypothetical protein
MTARPQLIRCCAVLLTLLPLAAIADQDEFCNGWYTGFVEGYKRASLSIFEPSVPLCPLQPRRTPRDPDSDYDHGYEVGYDQGREAGERRR